MAKISRALKIHYDALYAKAVSTLQIKPDGKYNDDEVKARLKEDHKLDHEAAEERWATGVLDFLARSESELDDDDDGLNQLVLRFENGDQFPFLPTRLIRDGQGNHVAASRALLDVHKIDLARSEENLVKVRKSNERKKHCVSIHEKWTAEEIAKGRQPLELTWGQCVIETGLLR